MIKMQAGCINSYPSFPKYVFMAWFCSFYIRFPEIYQFSANTKTRDTKCQNHISYRLKKKNSQKWINFWLGDHLLTSLNF